MRYNLSEYGLTGSITNEFNQRYDADKYYIGRISIAYKNIYKAITSKGEILGRISGKLEYSSSSTGDLPAVGDWVVLDREDNTSGDAIIHEVLSRKSCISRQSAGRTSDEQIIATNIDKVFICMSLNNDYNLRRLERYISLAWDSGAIPIIILTKSDLCDDLEDKIIEVEAIALGIDILAVSAENGEGIDKLNDMIYENETIAFIGSSGIGKSTLINILTGYDRQKVNTIRNDDKGKHTTTYREMIKLESGGIVIDTPGMREIQMYKADLDSSFSDIEDLALACKFSNCKHDTEIGCAVKEAIASGEITQKRLDNYRKLQKELEYISDRANMSSRDIEKKKTIEMTGSLGAIKEIRRNKR